MPEPLRVGHTGDIHLTSGPRFRSTLEVLHWIARDGEEAGVQLWLIGGDLGGTHDVPHVHTVEERNALDEWFQRLAKTAPVVILGGNHDHFGDLVGYGRLGAAHGISVVTEFAAIEAAGATLFCLPYPHKRTLLASAEGRIKQQNLDAADVLRTRYLEPWRAAEVAGPRILFGHLNIRGSHLSGDEVLAAQEVELTPEDLDGFRADYVALSHIHLHQQVAERAWYAGSPTAQSFGETDEKGYLVVEVARGAEPVIHRRLTPARKLVTVEARWVQFGGEWRWLADPAADLAAVPEGAEVRVRVEIPEEAAGSCPVDELAARFGEVAHSVAVDRRIVPRSRVRSEAIQQAKSNADRLVAWWESLGNTAPPASQQERIVGRLAELERAIAGETASAEPATEAA